MALGSLLAGPVACAPVAEPIPIIGGTGALGYGLAIRWARGGRSAVVIGSRKAERAEEAAASVRAAVPGAEVEGLENDRGGRAGAIVFLTVPFRAQSETLTNLKEALRPGQILVDCTVPAAAAVSGKATRTLGVWQGSAAQQAEEMVPEGVTVISALHTSVPRGSPTRPARRGHPDLRRPQGGQGPRRPADRADRGLRAVNAGALEMARIVETLTPLLISINVRYKAPPASGSRACPMATTGHEGSGA